MYSDKIQFRKDASLQSKAKRITFSNSLSTLTSCQLKLPFLIAVCWFGPWAWLAPASRECWAQTVRDSTNQFRFSGTISAASYGISPIPAFSLDNPVILGFLSLSKKRFSYDPQLAFSAKGVPWFFNNCFRYRLIDRPRFSFRGGIIWGLGYTYPSVDMNGSPKTIAKAERFIWLETTPRYVISPRLAISATTYSGHGFNDGEVDFINFVSVVGNFTKIPVAGKVYVNLFPQVFYLNIDNESDGVFFSGVFAVGVFGFPVTISTQINETFVTNLSPDPGFKWNIGVHYDF